MSGNQLLLHIYNFSDTKHAHYKPPNGNINNYLVSIYVIM